MKTQSRSRIPESELTGGLALVYKFGYSIVLVFMLAGLLYPLLGLDALKGIMTAGIVLLLSIPVVSTLWVGVKALRERDRGLLSIVLGIILLLVLARLVPLMFHS